MPPAAAHAASRDEKEESEVEKRVAYQVFSPSAEATPLLQNELIAGACHSGAYRLARNCPHAETDEATISACCVVASSEATAQLWLWPLLSGLASAGEGDEAEHYDTFFLEGLGANLTSRLLGCEARALLPPARKAHSSLLVWQPIWSGNFGHFLSEAMPRLLRLLPFLQARPKVNLYFAGGQAFNKDAFDLMFRRAGAAGLSERTLQYTIHALCMSLTRCMSPLRVAACSQVAPPPHGCARCCCPRPRQRKPRPHRRTPTRSSLMGSLMSYSSIDRTRAAARILGSSKRLCHVPSSTWTKQRRR